MDMWSIEMTFNRVVRKFVPNLRAVSNIKSNNAEDENIKPTSKEALKVLTEREKHLKDNIFKLIVESHVSDKSILRVLAFLINSFKKIK